MSARGKYTLGQLAKVAGLARNSLLHYESLGLLLPTGRSSAGYRLYGEAEVERLQNIRRLRAAGLSLEDIAQLLNAPAAKTIGPAALLEARLLELCAAQERIRDQQHQVARLLAVPGMRSSRKTWDKAAWTALLEKAGFDESAMQRWHAGFERDSPSEHAAFLKSLGLAAQEIARIRRWSRH